MLVLPHPLHAHRATQLAGKQRGLERDVVVAVRAVTARAVHVNEAKLGDVEGSSLAIVLRSRWVPCEAVHTVPPPSLISATAQDGPIEACDWIGQA